MPYRSKPLLGIGQAVALGLLHGPAELLPVSSSGHLTLVPWLLGWDYLELDDDLRKGFEVALHSGTAAALALALASREELSVRPLKLVSLAAAPPAIAGYLLERPIKRRLGTPETVAAGLVAGAVAMTLADGSPQGRRAAEAGAADALWLGAAQAAALVPGVSRNGATLAAARWRCFTRADAAWLSWRVALAPIVGAAALEALRVGHRAADVRFGAGAAAAFVSTLASRRLLLQERPLLPFAVYRLALAAGVLARSRTPPARVRRNAK
jgi:undecaprenyl-diphosphatase